MKSAIIYYILCTKQGSFYNWKAPFTASLLELRSRTVGFSAYLFVFEFLQTFAHKFRDLARIGSCFKTDHDSIVKYLVNLSIVYMYICYCKSKKSGKS